MLKNNILLKPNFYIQNKNKKYHILINSRKIDKKNNKFNKINKIHIKVKNL